MIALFYQALRPYIYIYIFFFLLLIFDEFGLLGLCFLESFNPIRFIFKTLDLRNFLYVNDLDINYFIIKIASNAMLLSKCDFWAFQLH